MAGRFECEIQTRLRDMNIGSHVDSVEAIRLIDEARILFLGIGREGSGEDVHSGLLGMVPAGVADLVASQRVDYRSEMRFVAFQPFLVRIWVGHVGRTSFRISTELRTAADHPPALVADTGVVMWDRAAEGPWPMAPAFRDVLEGYLDEPVALRP